MRRLPNVANTLGYVIVSLGEYGSYQFAPYRVLKPFRFAEKRDEYCAQWVKDPDNPLRTHPTPDGFVPWLVREGYIEDVSADMQEVHLGDTAQFNMDYNLSYAVFCPCGGPAATL